MSSEKETTISRTFARVVFNSRGSPAIEVDVVTKGGTVGRASAPSGASKGRFEAVDFPKGGIEEAMRAVDDLVDPALVGLDATDQEAIDKALHEVDGTANFSRIGGNTAYATSLASAKAASIAKGLPLYMVNPIGSTNELPYPLGNVIGGGKHALGKTPDIQEFLILPVGAKSFVEAVRTNIRVHEVVGRLLRQKISGFTSGKGDEGAWAARLTSEKALDALSDACEIVHNETGIGLRMGLDMAASVLWKSGEKHYAYLRDGYIRDKGAQLEFVLDLIRDYKLGYVEDPFHEEDFESLSELTKKARSCLICGDDLFVTNKERLMKGIAVGSGNSIIIKPNQIGTLTDARETVELAVERGYVPVLSHRSGETEDPGLAHLALMFGCPIVKTGILGGERMVKLNELIRIESQLKGKARMAKVRYVS